MTFVCIRCIQAGFTEEEATYPRDEGQEGFTCSDLLCEHCWAVDGEDFDWDYNHPELINQTLR